jgi:putative transposase
MLTLKPTQRDELLRTYRKDPDPELRFRAHIILLLADGHRWDTIEAVLFIPWPRGWLRSSTQ